MDGVRPAFSRFHFLPGALVVLVILVAGCSGGGGGGGGDKPPDNGTPQEPQTQTGSGTFSLPFPASLATYTNPNASIAAEVRIDNGAPFALSVDQSGKTVSGQTPALALGDHDFEITFYVAQGTTKVPIAIALSSVDITATTVPITFGPYRYTDSDGDGFTNLVELAMNTSWFDPASRPKADYPRSSGSYALYDTPMTNPLGDGSAIAGRAQSASYVDLGY